MKRTLLIVLALILLLVSCRPNIGLIPVPPRPSVGISAGDVEENLSFPKLVNDIINKAEGISWPDSWNEVAASTGNIEMITLNENAETVDKK